jgi:hypothetical protein
MNRRTLADALVTEYRLSFRRADPLTALDEADMLVNGQAGYPSGE